MSYYKVPFPCLEAHMAQPSFVFSPIKQKEQNILYDPSIVVRLILMDLVIWVRFLNSSPKLILAQGRLMTTVQLLGLQNK